MLPPIQPRKKKIRVKVKEDETTRNLKENLKTIKKNLSTIDTILENPRLKTDIRMGKVQAKVTRKFYKNEATRLRNKRKKIKENFEKYSNDTITKQDVNKDLQGQDKRQYKAHQKQINGIITRMTRKLTRNAKRLQKLTKKSNVTKKNLDDIVIDNERLSKQIDFFKKVKHDRTMSTRLDYTTGSAWSGSEQPSSDSPMSESSASEAETPPSRSRKPLPPIPPKPDSPTALDIARMRDRGVDATPGQLADNEDSQEDFPSPPSPGSPERMDPVAESPPTPDPFAVSPPTPDSRPDSPVSPPTPDSPGKSPTMEAIRQRPPRSYSSGKSPVADDIDFVFNERGGGSRKKHKKRRRSTIRGGNLKKRGRKNTRKYK